MVEGTFSSIFCQLSIVVECFTSQLRLFDLCYWYWYKDGKCILWKLDGTFLENKELVVHIALSPICLVFRVLFLQ